MSRFPSPVSTLLCCLLFGAPIAKGEPVAYLLQGDLAVSVSGNVTVSIDWVRLVTGVPLPFNGTSSKTTPFAGSLSWRLSDQATIDWGHPGWSGSFVIPAQSLAITPVGSAIQTSDSVSILQGLVNFGYTLELQPTGGALQFLDYVLPASIQVFPFVPVRLPSFDAPVVPATPGAGPWSAMETGAAQLALGLTASVSTTPGIGSIPINLLPALVPVPVTAGLERTGVAAENPFGTGSRYTVLIPALTDLVELADALAVGGNVCLIPGLGNACLGQISAIRVTLSDLEVSGIDGFLFAGTNDVAVVPVPGGLVLLPAALAALLTCRRRPIPARASGEA